MNTPNRNTVVQMTLDWIAWHGGDVHMGLYDELGHMYFNGHDHILQHVVDGITDRLAQPERQYRLQSQ